MAELIGENKVTLNTAAYFNPNVQSGQTRAGIEMPDYAAKYMDENDIIHPAVIYLTDDWFNSQGRLAYEEFKNALKDCDQVKQVAAANPGKID